MSTLFEIFILVGGFAAIGSAAGVLVVLAGWWLVQTISEWFWFKG
jgi:hypothetical protein